MSDLMLHGVLNCPIESGDAMGLLQLKSAAKRASDELKRKDAQIDEMEEVLFRLLCLLPSSSTEVEGLRAEAKTVLGKYNKVELPDGLFD